MTNGKAVVRSSQNTATEKDIDTTMKTIFQNLLDRFQIPEDIFSMRSRYANNFGKIDMTEVQPALMRLRLEYLYTFILHFPALSHTKNYKNILLYTEFSNVASKLNHYMRIQLRAECSTSLKTLIHLTNVMSQGLLESQMLWYNCWRCGLLEGDITSEESPVARCLALRYKVPAAQVVQLVGLNANYVCCSKAHTCSANINQILA